MKKYLLYFILLAASLAGCKKDKNNNLPPADKTYQVVFNASGSSQAISSGGKQVTNSLKTDAAGAAGNSAKKLYYLVFDSKNSLVHQIVQDSTVDNFGRITDKLSAGTYTVYIGAGQGSLTTSGTPNNFLYPYLTTAGLATTPVWGDTFFKKLTVTVTNTDINQDVTLERIVGQLQINVEDALPVNAKKFVVKIINESKYFDFTNETKNGTVEYDLTDIIPAASTGATNYKVTTIIGNTVSAMSVHIICYDAANNALADITISNVTCINNVKTVLSGKLFNTGGGFSIGLNNTWDPIPYTTVEY